ncbi:uncharacterized protein LOC110028715 [Phalaenopsis equestris]|uniref:uncharacterized protein LOC110028715 n=1 Tax=Phalaenopsis equestris TaxID=78828 RepID=UPI0009E377D8|nr:uncharacterized protein LOC110028715 [Phalaenopsis equestris]
MAIRFSFLALTIPVKANSSSKPKTRAQILRHGQAELETAAISLKKFAKLNKVFEDKESGVICYRDKNGELICEGYDEGPRLTWQTSQRIRSQARRYIVERPTLELNEIINWNL